MQNKLSQQYLTISVMHLKKKCKIIYSYLARAFNTIFIHSILLHNFHKFGIEGLALAISKK